MDKVQAASLPGQAACRHQKPPTLVGENHGAVDRQVPSENVLKFASRGLLGIDVI